MALDGRAPTLDIIRTHICLYHWKASGSSLQIASTQAARRWSETQHCKSCYNSRRMLAHERLFWAVYSRIEDSNAIDDLDVVWKDRSLKSFENILGFSPDSRRAATRGVASRKAMPLLRHPVVAFASCGNPLGPANLEARLVLPDIPIPTLQNCVGGRVFDGPRGSRSPCMPFHQRTLPCTPTAH